MHKYIILFSLAILSAFCTACSDKSSDSLSPEAAITSFSMGDFDVIYMDRNMQGNDTLVTRTVTGSTVHFSIDQINNVITNPDSLPAGSRLDSVKLSVVSKGNTWFRTVRADGTVADTLWSNTRYFNLNRPLTLAVKSEDATYTRLYVVNVNVHKADPDSMTWKKVTALPLLLNNSRAVSCNGNVMVMGSDASGVPGFVSISEDACDGWSDFSQCYGLDANADPATLTRHGDSFAILDGGRIMTSTDLAQWSETVTDTQLKSLVPFLQTGDGGQAWAVTADNCLAVSENLSQWTVICEVPAMFPDTSLNGMCYPLRNNRNINRYVVAGLVSDGSTSYSPVWTKLSTEISWTFCETSDFYNLRCPAFAGLSVLLYDDNLFAFGGEDLSGNAATGPMEGFYQSNDNGITWRYCDSFFDSYNTWNPYMQMPEGLTGYEGTFCFTVDGRNRIWIVTPDTAGVWKGYINRLYRK